MERFTPYRGSPGPATGVTTLRGFTEHLPTHHRCWAGRSSYLPPFVSQGKHSKHECMNVISVFPNMQADGLSRATGFLQALFLPSSPSSSGKAASNPSLRSAYPDASSLAKGFNGRLSCKCKSSLQPAISSTPQRENVEFNSENDRVLSHRTAESLGYIGPQTPELPHGLNAKLLPKHVAIIMDGNSRWAEARGVSRYAGHQAGVHALKQILRLSCAWSIQALTVFAFSVENWGRPKAEVSFLMTLFQKTIQVELADFLKENIRVHFIGDIGRLPSSLQVMISDVEERTRYKSGLKLTVAMNYSGHHDIVRACQSIALDVQSGKLSPEEITQATVENKLGTSWIGEAGNPDLLIRTSGEQRLSNFLLWQLAYTELLFLDECWPDMDEALYARALLYYQTRSRRYGKRP